MNISILVYDISLTGGAERVALNLAEELKKYHDVSIISLFMGNNPSNKNEGIIVLSKTTVSITRCFYKLSWELHQQLKKQKTDVLIAITAGVVTLAIVASIGLNTKTVFSEHSNLENKTYGIKHQLRQRIGSRFCDCVVTLTERDKKNFQNAFGLSEEKVVVIPNWYEPKKAEENKEYDALSKRIISVGRLEYVKGYDYLIEIAKKINIKHKDWCWDIYGEGSLHHELQIMIEKAKLQGFVSLKGNVNNLEELYGRYAFLVMTSRFEGLPMTLLEAKAHGLPIVSFDCPTGPAEIVENDINGFITKAYDIDAITGAIEELINDDKKRIQFANESKRNMTNYSKSIVLDKWLCLFKEILERENR